MLDMKFPLIFVAAVLSSSGSWAASDGDSKEPGKTYQVEVPDRVIELPEAFQNSRVIIEQRAEREKMFTEEQKRQAKRTKEREAKKEAKLKEIEIKRAEIAAAKMEVIEAQTAEADANINKFVDSMAALGIPAVQLKSQMDNPHSRIVAIICDEKTAQHVDITDFLNTESSVTVEKDALTAAFAPTCE